MKRYVTFGLFCCVALLQLAAVGSMVVKRELTLHKGKLWKFRTAPVDPYDAFRGRYVALRFEGMEVEGTVSREYKGDQKVYALLEETPEGFARVKDVAIERPEGDEYVEASVQYGTTGKKVDVALPIDRYYMNETKAPEAERLYRERNRRETRDAYAAVRIRKGFAVIEGLYVGGKRIEDFVEDGK